MILKRRAFVCAVTAALIGLPASTGGGQTDSGRISCDPALAARFVPRRPLLGRYEVCADPRALTDVAPPGWAVKPLDPADAFGAAGTYNRTTLARLYGADRARVVRGWIRGPDRFESLTLISPHPNAALTALEPGTLIIRWICEGRQAPCRMLNAK